MTIWVADAALGLMRVSGGGCQRIGPPGSAVCQGGGRVYCAGQTRGICCDRETGETLFDFPVPTGVCALSLLGDAVCALSSDADSICAFCARTGAPLYSAPAGAYPRGMCKSPCGKYLAVAGGAAGEILLFDESLTCVQKRRVAGAACAVCFLPRALAALCAVGDGELSSRLLLISQRGVTEEWQEHPAAPCCLCALRGGGCLMGCHGSILCLRADGHVSDRVPCAYPVRLLPTKEGTLLCDGWQGSVRFLAGGTVYQGREPCDAAVTP